MRPKKLILIFLLSLLFSGCSSNNLYDLPYFSEDYNVVYENYYTPTSLSFIKDVEKIDNNISKDINELCKDVCSYLNENYNANWISEPLSVFSADITDNISVNGHDLGALYFKKNIYIDLAFLNNNNIKKTYILSHEIIHYLQDINYSNQSNFSLTTADRKLVVGEYLEEATVDMLAKRYILAKYPEINKEELSSGYKYIRMYAELLDLSIPNYLYYYFNGDITGLQKEFNSIANNHINCKGNAFEKWLKLLDLTYSKNNSSLLGDYVSVILNFSAVTTSKKFKNELIRRTEIVDFPLSLCDYMY